MQRQICFSQKYCYPNWKSHILYKLDRDLLVLLQKNYEGQLKRNQQQDGLEQQQPTRNKTGSQKPIKDKNSMVIRGVTFYKAEEESYIEEEKDERGKSNSTQYSPPNLWVWMFLYSLLLIIFLSLAHINELMIHQMPIADRIDYQDYLWCQF